MPDDYVNDLLDTATKGPEPIIARSGAARVTGLLARGATFGVGGAQVPPRDLTETGIEMVGSVPSTMAVSAAVSPVVGMAAKFAPILKVPVAQRLAGAALSGAAIGGTESFTKGESVGKGALEGATQFAAIEGAGLGIGKAIKALRAPKVASKITGAVEAPAKIEPSPLSGVAKEQAKDVAMGRMPETPVQLTLPMAQPGTSQLKLPGLEDVPLTGRAGRLASKTIGEVENAKQFPETDSPWEAFKAYEDPKLGRVMEAPSPEAAHVLDVAKGLDPRQLEFPLAPEQMTFLEGRFGTGVKRELDVTTKQEALRTESLLKQPEEVIKKAVEEQSAPLVDIKHVSMTPEGFETSELAKKVQIGADRLAALSGWDRDQVLKFLKENCP